MVLLMRADRVVSKAIKGSYFSVLPTTILKQLLAEAVRLDVPAGSTLYRESNDPKVGLVITGLSINGLASRPASGPAPFPRLGSGSRVSLRLGSGFAL